MSSWHLCPKCEEDDDIATIHDTLYMCNVCGHNFNPIAIYG